MVFTTVDDSNCKSNEISDYEVCLTMLVTSKKEFEREA